MPKMYIDSKGYVTTGIGNLIGTTPKNPLEAVIKSEALRYPWKRDDGSLASREEILSAFETVKNSGMNNAGGGNQTHLTNISLDRSFIYDLFDEKAEEFESRLKEDFPLFDQWPADAQLALMSMSWGLGPAFARGFPKFTAAANQLIPDFEQMAKEAFSRDFTAAYAKFPEIAGKISRNMAHESMFMNAAKALQSKANADILFWPHAVSDTALKTGLGIGGIMFFSGSGYLLYSYLKNKGIL